MRKETEGAAAVRPRCEDGLCQPPIRHSRKCSLSTACIHSTESWLYVCPSRIFSPPSLSLSLPGLLPVPSSWLAHTGFLAWPCPSDPSPEILTGSRLAPSLSTSPSAAKGRGLPAGPGTPQPARIEMVTMPFSVPGKLPTFFLSSLLFLQLMKEKHPRAGEGGTFRRSQPAPPSETNRARACLG